MPKQMDSSRRGKKILEAAFDCFIIYGYAKTSMEDIAHKADISRPLLYETFKNKEDILVSIFDEQFKEQFKAIEKIMSFKMNKKKKLLEVMEVFVIALWSKIVNSSHGEEIFDVYCGKYPALEAKRYKKFLDIIIPLLGDKGLAEVFVHAITGQKIGRPSASVLRKRIFLLTDQFTKICLRNSSSTTTHERRAGDHEKSRKENRDDQQGKLLNLGKEKDRSNARSLPMLKGDNQASEDNTASLILSLK
jgi:AcrR family transcriptional regulator